MKYPKLGFNAYRICIAVCVFIIFFLQTFLLVDGTNVFASYFTDWASLQVTMPITVGGYIAIVTTFLLSSWLIRHKGNVLMLVLILLSGVSVIALANSENAYPIYVAAIVIINITMAILLILGTAIVTNWFDSTRGRMLGFVTIGAPFSTAVCVPVIQRMITAGVPFRTIFTVIGGSPNLNPSMIVNVFGHSEYLNVNRYCNVGQNILRLFALVMMSSIHDLTGSYTPGYVVCVILSIVALLCFVGIRNRYSEEAN